MAAEGEELVGAGVFKVDRARALEKLMRFALPDAAFGPLLLVRCAAACGASSLSIRREGRGKLTVTFDGETFSREELAHPYEPLFKRQAVKTRRGRELATAILTLLRLEPSEVLVRSGARGARHQLKASRGEPETVTEILGSAEATAVLFNPGPRTDRSLWGRDFEASLKRSALMAPMPLFLDEQRLPHGLPEGWQEEGEPVDAEGLRGWLALPSHSSEASWVELYKLGVLVGTCELQLSTAGLQGRVNCDDFRLNASQTSVVRDERFRKAVSALNEAARALASSASERQKRRAPLAARLLASPDLRQVWVRETERFRKARSDTLLSSLSGFFSQPAGVDRSLEKELQEDARRCAWLKETAARSRKGKEPDPAALAPTSIGAHGGLLSYAQLSMAAAGLGYLPFSAGLYEGVRLAYPVVWLPDEAEKHWLSRLFPGTPLSDAGPALERAHRFGETDRSSAPTLETLGVNGILTRAPLPEPLSGEAGLASHLPAGAALHLFVDGAVERVIPLGAPLRLSLVSVDPGIWLEEGSLRRLAEWSKTLYKSLARDFSADDAGPDDAPRRAHLFDALAFWGSRPGEAAPAWLENLLLFPCDAGLLDFKTLRERLAGGDTLFFMRRRARLAAPTLSFRDQRFDEGFLAALFPGAEVKSVPGIPDMRAVWKAEPPRPLPESGHIADDERAALLEDILRREGALPESDADPKRLFVLDSVSRLFTPWLGAEAPTQRWRHLREHLAFVPFFRRPRTGTLSLSQIDARLAGARPLTWTEEPGGAGDCLLSPQERALAAALWPGAPIHPAQASQRRPQNTRAARSGDAPARRAPPPGILYSAPVEGEGLKGSVSLAPDPLPGVVLVLTGRGDPVEMPLPTPGFAAAGTMLLDASGWSGPLRSGAGPSASLARAGAGLYRSFLDGLLTAWPALAAQPEAESLRTYLLLFAAGRPGTAREWEAVREKLAGLPLFSTLGGGTASLSELSARGRLSGRVVYAKSALSPCPQSLAAVPVIRMPRLAAAALDCPLVAYDDPSQAPAAATGEPLRDALESLLASVRGRAGLDPAVLPDAGRVVLRGGDGRSVLVREGADWVVDTHSPAVKLVLSSFKGGPLCAPLLASLIVSAANRESRRATDAHDALFQTLLAQALDASALPD